MKKTTYLWIIATVITLLAAYYQRITGPTYDKKIKITLNNNDYSFKLPRTHTESDCEIVLEIPDESIQANLYYRQYPTNNEWIELKMLREGSKLIAFLPQQPPAGKLSYYLIFEFQGEKIELLSNDPVKIRFRNHVPDWALVPHILIIFTAMLLSNMSGILAIVRRKQFRFYSNLTLITLFFGGMILGPIVQKFAFDEYWTGIPFGWDLTDNKTLISFICWILAVVMNRKKERPAYVIVASLIMLIIFSIPHSVFGSQLNPETGEIVPGMIYLFF